MSAEAGSRPGTVTTGAVLLVLSGLMSATIVVGATGQGHLSVALAGATFWFAVRAGRGRRVARTTACVLAAALALLAAPYAWVLPPSSPYWPGLAVRHLLALTTGCAGAVLLHRPYNAAYFAARSPR